MAIADVRRRMPDGFKPHTFASLVAKFLLTHPKMAVEMALLAEPTCDAGHELGPGVEVIRRLEGAGLIHFAENPEGEPALFAAADEAFDNEADRLAADRMTKWFDRSGEWNAATGELVRETSGLDPLRLWLARNAWYVEFLQSEARCSRRVVMETLERWEADMPRYFVLSKHGTPVFRTDVEQSESDRRIWAAVESWRPKRAGYQHLSYMRALEAQIKALSLLEETAGRVREGKAGPAATEVIKLFHADMLALRSVGSFCWFVEPLHASQVAAASLPGTSRLRWEDVEVDAQGGGWWYFMEPLPLPTATGLNEVAALLWWHLPADDKGPAGVTLSLYGEDESLGLVPSTRWVWWEGETLDALLERAENEFEVSAARYAARPFGRAETLQAVRQVSRLWLAGSLWCRQKILTFTEGPVERHERKRIQRLVHRPVAPVRVVELRRRHTVPMSPGGGGKVVDWSCRWVVSGHWREQWYESRGEHQTIWIDAYVKGPDDLPLKSPVVTVYKVDR